MKKRITYVLILLGMVVLSACVSKKTSLDAKMKEFAFIPDSITVPTGSEVGLNLENIGTLEREYVIMILDKEASVSFGDDDEANIYWEQELPAGESTTVQFTAPSEPGVDQVVCGTAGHLKQGMKGKLIVTNAQ